MIEGNDTNAPVGYDFVNLARWTASTETTASSVIKESYTETVKNENVITTVTTTDLVSNIALARNYIRNDYAFTNRTKDFFRSLAYCARVVTILEPTNAFVPNSATFEGKTVYEAYLLYKEYKALYDYFKDGINESVEVSGTIAKNLTGHGL